MRCKILHESKNRMRVHLFQKHMTCAEADKVEYFLLSLPFIDEVKVSEHVQVRNALFNLGEKNIEEKLYKLANLRRTADYDPFRDLTTTDVSNAIGYMENIFSHLKFD